MWRSTLALAGAICVIGMLSPSRAAELRLPARAHFHHHVRTLYCGPCGCLGVFYVHHRELRSTYGLDFDPRNYDTTEPHYYFGPIRAYPRYVVWGVPGRTPCRG